MIALSLSDSGEDRLLGPVEIGPAGGAIGLAGRPIGSTSRAAGSAQRKGHVVEDGERVEQRAALITLSQALKANAPTLVEVESGRAILQLITHDVARAALSVFLLVPGDAYPLLAPALRRPFFLNA